MPCGCSAVDVLTEDAHEIHSLHDPFTDSYAKPHYQPRLPLRPTHLDLDLSFDIPARTVKGRITHTVVAQWSGAKTIDLNAEDFTELKVSSPDDDRLSYFYDGHIVQVVFTVPFSKGQKVSIHIDYAVVDPIDGVLFSREGDGHFVVSDHETERARYWLPVVDHPVVRTTIFFTLRTPAADQLTALANGSLISEDIEDGVKITKWEMKQITPSYLLCVAIGKFIKADGGEHKGKKIAYFAPIGGRHAYTVEDLALTFGPTKEMIEFMEKKVHVDLPWPKYYQWCCGEVGGAMENSSLVSYDEWYMLDERSTSERAHRVSSTVVHELAHSWFGDLVVCSDFCHSFLKESFATLISAEWYHYKNGNDDFQYTLARYSEVSFAETMDYMRPIVTRKYESSWSVFDRHLYTNGAWRLHMLRVKLGDEVFWNAVSFYLQKRSWKTVETDDFRKDLEEYSGEQLCSYFEQWFYSKGHPILEASFSYDNSKGGYATVSLKQTQADERKGVGLFDVSVDVALEVTSGAWETHTITMESGASTGQFVVRLHNKPLQVIIDPDKKVLHHLAKFSGVGDDMSLRSLAHAPTFAGRQQAVKLLHESGSKRGRLAVAEALKKEKHWGLRSMIAQNLGKSARTDTLSALIDAAFSEPDARVVPLILNAIGEYRHPKAEEALLKYAKEGHEMMRSYGAIATAIRMLGRTRNLEHLDLITDFLENPIKHGKGFEIPQCAAVALGQLRDWKATEVLMRNADPPNMKLAPRIRGTVVRAIGQAVTWEGPVARMKAFDFVEKICKSDEVKSVREAAGSVLASLADAGSPTGALEELEKTVENQSKAKIRGFRRRAKRSANGREGSIKAMSLQFEKMQTELTELKTKLEEMQSTMGATKATKDKANGESSPSGDNATDGKTEASSSQ